MIDESDLVNASDIAREHGTSRMAVSRWKRGLRGTEPFPAPVITLSGIAFYSRKQVNEWVAKPRPNGVNHIYLDKEVES